MTEPVILAIDTATKQAGLALLAGENLLAEWSWQTAGQHSADVGRLLPEMLALVSISPRSIEGIAVASGPGSFNGLRAGISTAKGLALALHIPLVGVSTLDIIGFQASRMKGDVWALLPAGRSEVYRCTYAGGGNEWKRRGEYERLAIESVVAAYVPGIVLAGEGAPLIAAEVAGGRALLVDGPAGTLRRAGYLAELGGRHFRAGGDDQIDTLEPLYLRRSSAEEQRMRVKGK